MADLLVRGVEEVLVRALKKQAGEHGRSAEAEHRDILKAVLLSPPRRTLADLLAAMPDVGRDEDFERRSEGVALLNPFQGPTEPARAQRWARTNSRPSQQPTKPWS